jgi:hypothetical protein
MMGSCEHGNEPWTIVKEGICWLAKWLLVSRTPYKQGLRTNVAQPAILLTIIITLTTLQTRLIAKHRSVSHFCHVALRLPTLRRVSQKPVGVRIIHAYDNINWFHLAPSCEE